MATERKMPKITVRALEVLMRFPSSRVSSERILILAIATEAPKSSKTIDTVVDVGIP